MAKKIMQDMQSKGVKITKISRSDISSNVKVINRPIHTHIDQDNNINTQISDHSYNREKSERLYSYPSTKKNNPKVRKSLRVLLLLSIIFSGVYFVTNVFSNVKIVIKEKVKSFKLENQQLTALNREDGSMRFEIMIISDEDSKKVSLTESEKVSIKAHGEVTLYNEYSTKFQNLAVRTLISDNSGKTYQLDKAVTIPGYTTKDSKIVPGKISVGITSFLPGDAYNGSPTDFYINLFKGTAKGKKIYGKLKSPLIGGAQGLVYKLSPQDLGTLNAYASSTYRGNLLKKMNAEVPKGYILYNDAVTYSYKIDDTFTSKTSDTEIKINATISSIIINEKDLVNNLLKKLIEDINQSEIDEIEIPNISQLKFSFLNKDQSIAKDLKTITFSLSGGINMIWHPDIESLKNKILGLNKSDLPLIFKNDPGIDSASIKIFPPWSSRIPNHISNIDISTK